MHNQTRDAFWSSAIHAFLQIHPVLSRILHGRALGGGKRLAASGVAMHGLRAKHKRLAGRRLGVAVDVLQKPKEVAVGRENQRGIATESGFVGVECFYKLIKVGSGRAGCVGLGIDF